MLYSALCLAAERSLEHPVSHNARRKKSGLLLKNRVFIIEDCLLVITTKGVGRALIIMESHRNLRWYFCD